ncbi:MAG: hypothetical protein AAFN77_14605 [Planctomycetota bacterium]
MKKAYLTILLLFCFAPIAQADLVLTGVGVATVEDFTGFEGLGLGTGVGQLDSATWSIAGFSSSSDLSRGSDDGGVGTGGVYSFDTSNSGAGEQSLGVQPGGSDFTAGSFTASVMNNTGGDIDSFEIGYDVSVFNDQGRSNSFNFSYSTDGTTFIPVAPLDFSSPGTATGASWNTSNLSTTIDFASPLGNGTTFFIRWTGDDVSGSGSRDEFALDNISITPLLSAIPEPSSFLMFAVTFGVLARRRK